MVNKGNLLIALNLEKKFHIVIQLLIMLNEAEKTLGTKKIGNCHDLYQENVIKLSYTVKLLNEMIKSIKVNKISLEANRAPSLTISYMLINNLIKFRVKAMPMVIISNPITITRNSISDNLSLDRNVSRDNIAFMTKKSKKYIIDIKTRSR